MEKNQILLTSIKSFCTQIQEQQALFPAPQANPLYNTAVDIVKTALNESVERLMTKHNFTLPQNWTYSQIVNEIIGEPADLLHIYYILHDVIIYDFASSHFHEVLNFIHNILGG